MSRFNQEQPEARKSRCKQNVHLLGPVWGRWGQSLLMVWVDAWGLDCRVSERPWERAGSGKKGRRCWGEQVTLSISHAEGVDRYPRSRHGGHRVKSRALY